MRYHVWLILSFNPNDKGDDHIHEKNVVMIIHIWRARTCILT